MCEDIAQDHTDALLLQELVSLDEFVIDQSLN
jgi:hypothetical protein